MAYGGVSPSVPILIVLPTKLGYFVANLSGSHFASAAIPADGRKSATACNATTKDNARYFAMTLTFRCYLSLQRDEPHGSAARSLSRSRRMHAAPMLGDVAAGAEPYP